jgi:hypothetical protein
MDVKISGAWEVARHLFPGCTLVAPDGTLAGEPAPPSGPFTSGYLHLLPEAGLVRLDPTPAELAKDYRAARAREIALREQPDAALGGLSVERLAAANLREGLAKAAADRDTAQNALAACEDRVQMLRRAKNHWRDRLRHYAERAACLPAAHIWSFVRDVAAEAPGTGPMKAATDAAPEAQPAADLPESDRGSPEGAAAPPQAQVCIPVAAARLLLEAAFTALLWAPPGNGDHADWKGGIDGLATAVRAAAFRPVAPEASA